MSITLQCTKWLIVSVASLSGIISSISSRSFSVSSSSSSPAAAAAAASVELPSPRDVAAATDDCGRVWLWSVVVFVVVDFIASRTCPQLRRAAADRRRPAATRQRRAHRGHGARRQRHADHRHVYLTDARVGRRTNRTHCVGGTLTRPASLVPVRCHRQRLVTFVGNCETVYCITSADSS